MITGSGGGTDADEPPKVEAICDLKCPKCDKVVAQMPHEHPLAHDKVILGFILGRYHEECDTFDLSKVAIRREPPFFMCMACGKVRNLCQVAYPQQERCCKECTHPQDPDYKPIFKSMEDKKAEDQTDAAARKRGGQLGWKP